MVHKRASGTRDSKLVIGVSWSGSRCCGNWGSGSWRLIDNARASHHNRTFEATERIHTTSANVSMAFWRRFREQLGKPLSAGWQPMAGTTGRFPCPRST